MEFSPPVIINNRKIGPDFPVYIIAELSANHNQNYEKAVALVQAAKKAGADAIKLQTYTADTITINCDNEFFKIKGTIWEGKNLYELYQEAFTPWDWHPRLKKVANELGMDLFSTPFDFSAVEFLENMGVPAYKIASFENGDIPLIKKIAGTGRPIIMSTGMAGIGEIEEAVDTIYESGNRQLALLKCSSAYPAPAAEMNLRAIQLLRDIFQVPVGISDHTLGISVPIAAVALGANIIEKHFTLDRKEPGPDSTFSLEPQEFKEMVAAVRICEKALGKNKLGPGPEELKSRVFRRSLFVVKDMDKGEEFTVENLRSIRPANGLHTRYYEQILGKKASNSIKMGTPLSWALVSGEGN
ncbi:pseudaminic acid synthase [Candidatus Riflebacteria bacterium]